MADKIAEEETEVEAEIKPKKPLSTAKIIILVVILTSLLSGGIVGLTMYLLSGNDTPENTVTDKDKQPDDEEKADDDEKADDEEKADDIKKSVNPEAPVIYHQMNPKFVVSFRDQKIASFMQFSLQVMTRDKEVITQLTMHSPAIRSNLLLLFNSQDAMVMKTREGKEALLAAITEDINKSLEALSGDSGVEAAYFDSFLIQ